MAMIRRHHATGTCGALLFFLAALHRPPEVLSAELKPATVAAFNRYVQATETRIDGELKRPARFLYIDGLPEAQRLAALAALKRGEIFMERLKTADQAGHEIKAPDGLIHHWVGAVFVPGASLPQVLALVQDYDRHQYVYRPEVVRSKLVSRSGNDFKIFYRLRKKKLLVTVTLNTDHDVHYFPIDATHCHSRSYTSRIQEVDDADEATERQKPVGQDNGFLWRLYSYWRFEQKDGGVYVECESISLTRDIPWLFSPIIKPFVIEIPKESLQMTMGSTRRVLLEEAAARQAR
jgi:hypothetical protein